MATETPTDETLDLIPRSIRNKLDRIGIKLHLRDWQALSLAERERLRDCTCETAAEVARYAQQVDELVMRVTGKAAERMRR